MKLILSRKGFDSASGGVPSPILPDGRIISLPIPDDRSRIRFGNLSYGGRSLADMVGQLTKGAITPEQGAHLDPDLHPDALSRPAGWRPIFGQSGAAQAHLENNGIAVGDLFVFFGLFRPVVEDNGILSWNRNTPPMHLIWGWLQIGAMISVADATAAECNWMHYHPHFQRADEKNNRLYLADDNLVINGEPTGLPGAGVFTHYCPERQLTAQDGDSVTVWELPRWCYPRRKHIPFTYHSDRTRWQRQKHRTLLRSVARGQEFIMDAKVYPEAIAWVQDMIRRQHAD